MELAWENIQLGTGEKKKKNFDLDAPCVSDTNYTVSQSIDNYTALDQQECNHQTNRR